MLKVFIQQAKIPKYRIDIFNLLSKRYCLTVIHEGPIISKKIANFNQIIKKRYTLGPFFYQNFFNLVDRADILITEANLRYLFNNLILAFFPRKYKWISWGIGLSASYKNKFDSNNQFDFFRYLFFGRSDALLFYSSYPVKKYKSAGILQHKLFVAHNTISNKCEFSKNRNYFVFIGSLHKGKGLLDLVKEYNFALKSSGNKLPPLIIIGGGQMKNELKSLIKKEKIKTKVKLYGYIFDKNKLNKLISKALFSVSPKQAGLSVLHSMSCGVAFVTSKNAITGGEIFNISSKNGILINDIKQLRDIFLDAYKNQKKYILIGKNAYNFYYKNRSLNIMANGFLDAINYARKV
jgi:glycosyltransferase involved in cell wall biosynthesis